MPYALFVPRKGVVTVEKTRAAAMKAALGLNLDVTADDARVAGSGQATYRPTAAYAWGRVNRIRIDPRKVEQMSLAEAWSRLVHFFPKEGKRTPALEAGDTALLTTGVDEGAPVTVVGFTETSAGAPRCVVRLPDGRERKVERGELRGNRAPVHPTLSSFASPTRMMKSFLQRAHKTEKSKISYELVQEIQWAIDETYGQGYLGIDVMGLSLMPHTSYNKAYPGSNIHTCVGATAACQQTCLFYSGRNAEDPYNLALKSARTKALLTEPHAFGRMLAEACLRHAGFHPHRTPSDQLYLDSDRDEMLTKHVPMVRLNLFSDLPWELIYPELFDEVDMTFYDYTKLLGRRPPRNYDLTLAYAGSENRRVIEQELGWGGRVAMVFLVRDGRELPEEILGYPVLDGSGNDVRPLDQAAAVVGLPYRPPPVPAPRTRGKPLKSAFVVAVEELEGHLVTALTPNDQPGVARRLDVGDALPADAHVSTETRRATGVVPRDRLRVRNAPSPISAKAQAKARRRASRLLHKKIRL